jgi:purine-nucleoside phosphorylase
MTELERNLATAVEFIQEKCQHRPKIGVILGSGLGNFGESLEDAQSIAYEEIPNFPVSTVEGHKGRFLITKDLICMQGRFHFYEGYNMTQVTFPIRVMKLLGVESLIVTNASGGISTEYRPGELVIISDHINLMGMNPLIGKNLDGFGTRFPDMSEAYDKELISLAEKAGEKLGMKLPKGVYIGVSGPSFETPAEIRMARTLGADMVGMSTVPEVIVARHSGMRVLGISCVTNPAAGVQAKPLCHEEVIETTERVKTQFTNLVWEIIREMLI